MALDRANYYDKANRTAQDFGASGPMPKPRMVLWHSTEGAGWPAYNDGAVAPHLTVAPDWTNKRLVWRQHFPFSQFGKSLVNKPGGVETNRAGVIQVEIVGTCDPGTHEDWGKIRHLYMPALPDWAVRDLADFTLWCKQHHGIPFKHAVFKAYPGSYGNTANRFTAREWNAFEGHCGHQHAPESSHGDPGAFPIDDIMDAAERQEEDEDMPSIDEIRKAIRKEIIDVLTGEAIVPNAKQAWEDPAVPNKPFTIVGALSNIEKDTDTAPVLPVTPVAPVAPAKK